MLPGRGCGCPGRRGGEERGAGAGGVAAGTGGQTGAARERNGVQRQQEREPEPVWTGQTNQKWESFVHCSVTLAPPCGDTGVGEGPWASRCPRERSLQVRPDLDEVGVASSPRTLL